MLEKATIIYNISEGLAYEYHLMSENINCMFGTAKRSQYAGVDTRRTEGGGLSV